MTASELAVRARIASLVRELLNERSLTYAQTGIPEQRLSAVIHCKVDLKLSTLVRVAEALDCDVVINLRERRPS